MVFDFDLPSILRLNSLWDAKTFWAKCFNRLLSNILISSNAFVGFGEWTRFTSVAGILFSGFPLQLPELAIGILRSTGPSMLRRFF